MTQEEPSATVQAKENKAQARAEEIVLQAMEETPLKAQDYLGFLTGMDSQTNEEQERIAFIRLFGGYDANSDWKTTITSLNHLQEPTVYLRWIEEARSEVDDDCFRLMGLHKTLNTLTNQNTRQALYHHIALTLGSLEFAYDWAQYTYQDQGKLKKTRFYRSSFARELGLDNGGVLSDEALERLATDTHRDKYQTWYNRNSQIVTARNRLHRLYRTYGVAAFLDPFWSPHNITNNARSKSFASLIEALSDQTEPLNLASTHVASLEVTSLVINTLDNKLGRRFGLFHASHHTTICAQDCDPMLEATGDVRDVRRRPTPEIPGRMGTDDGEVASDDE